MSLTPEQEMLVAIRDAWNYSTCHIDFIKSGLARNTGSCDCGAVHLWALLDGLIDWVPTNYESPTVTTSDDGSPTVHNVRSAA